MRVRLLTKQSRNRIFDPARDLLSQYRPAREPKLLRQSPRIMARVDARASVQAMLIRTRIMACRPRQFVR
jgi:hypothetical protein